MHVYAQVWYLLERCLTNRVPEAQALIWKSTRHCTSDARHHGHECGAGSVIELAHVMRYSWPLDSRDSLHEWAERLHDDLLRHDVRVAGMLKQQTVEHAGQDD
jgi:hypothetical protein